MAKIRGPLLSTRASGRFGGVLSFRDTARGPVATRYHYPGSRRLVTPSQAQLDVRAAYGSLVAQWRALTQPQRDQWDADAPKGQSGWSYFVQKNLPGALAPPAFAPTDLPGLAIWLDADDPATITLNGSNVASWTDKSANGFVFAQSVTAQQPPLVNAAINNKPALSFAGGDGQGLISSGNVDTGVGAGPFYVVVIAQPANIGVDPYNTICGWATWDWGWEVTAGAWDVWGLPTVLTFNTPAVEAPTLAELYRDPADIVSAVFNGVVDSVSGARPDPWATSTANIGAAAQPAIRDSWNGYIAELVIGAGELTTQQRMDLRNYLATKWGITLP